MSSALPASDLTDAPLAPSTPLALPETFPQMRNKNDEGVLIFYSGAEVVETISNPVVSDSKSTIRDQKISLTVIITIVICVMTLLGALLACLRVTRKKSREKTLAKAQTVDARESRILKSRVHTQPTSPLKWVSRFLYFCYENG